MRMVFVVALLSLVQGDLERPVAVAQAPAVPWVDEVVVPEDVHLLAEGVPTRARLDDEQHLHRVRVRHVDVAQLVLHLLEVLPLAVLDVLALDELPDEVRPVLREVGLGPHLLEGASDRGRVVRVDAPRLERLPKVRLGDVVGGLHHELAGADGLILLAEQVGQRVVGLAEAAFGGVVSQRVRPARDELPPVEVELVLAIDVEVEEARALDQLPNPPHLHLPREDGPMDAKHGGVQGHPEQAVAPHDLHGTRRRPGAGGEEEVKGGRHGEGLDKAEEAMHVQHAKPVGDSMHLTNLLLVLLVLQLFQERNTCREYGRSALGVQVKYTRSTSCPCTLRVLLTYSELGSGVRHSACTSNVLQLYFHVQRRRIGGVRTEYTQSTNASRYSKLRSHLSAPPAHVCAPLGPCPQPPSPLPSL